VSKREQAEPTPAPQTVDLSSQWERFIIRQCADTRKPDRMISPTCESDKFASACTGGIGGIKTGALVFSYQGLHTSGGL